MSDGVVIHTLFDRRATRVSVPSTERSNDLPSRTGRAMTTGVAHLSMKSYEKLTGLTTAEWEGSCFAVANMLAPHFGGTAVYGHWLGKINPAGHWKTHARQGFCNHGWIVVPNKHGKYGVDTETIVDPTRWSFEAKKPYIWQGKNDGTYDEGGNRFRMAMRGHEPPDDDDTREPLTIDLLSEESYENVKQICKLGPFHEFSPEYPFLGYSLARWLANTDPAVIGWWCVAEIYEALAKAGLKAAIPIDNWRMVARYFGLRDYD